MGQVRVWWSLADAPASADALLTDAERHRLAALAHPVDRAQLRSAHVLLRRLAGETTGSDLTRVVVAQRCERCGGPHGQPTVTVDGEAGPHATIAHAGGLVMAAVSDAPVGVDLEPTGGAPREVAEVALSAMEQDQLARLSLTDRPEAVTRWWVRKEAVLKAVGVGLSLDPSDVEVSPPDRPPRLVGWRGEGRPRWMHMADLDIDEGIVAAVAAVTRRPLRVTVARVSLSQLPA